MLTSSAFDGIFSIMQKTSLFLLLSFSISSVLSIPARTAEKYDLVITNARIVDGTGNPWFRGSIAVKNGRIAKVGWFDKSGAKEIIDARDNIVAPGFIDVHAHSEDVFEQPKAENFIRMGVTTLVTGNCGGSHTDVGEFLGKIKKTPIAINISTLIGHNSVRSRVMGLDDRAPTPNEQKKMKERVGWAMREGSVGCSSGVI